MTAACVIAIDQGTTSTRVLVVNDRGRTIASTGHELPLLALSPGWVEHDPERIWADVCSLIGESLARIEAVRSRRRRDRYREPA